MRLIGIIIAGFVLDLLLGDPDWIPHPIVLIGKMISGLEKLIRGILPKTAEWETIGGVILTLVVTCVSFVVPAFVILLLGHIDTRIALVLEVFWCWQIFAARSLAQAALRVYDQIVIGDLPKSRKFLSWIVGRDTGELNFRQIIKAVVETVAENTSDGIIAPMFYMMIGGVPLGFFYKAANTLDSMVGYKNETYLHFGSCSAHFDDIMNYIPARLTGLAMCLCAPLAGLDGRNAWKIYRRDRHNHASPNSAHPESAVAGALNVQLAGDAYYFGELYKKKTIGDDIRPIEKEDIPRTNRLMYTVSVFLLILMAAVRFGIIYWIMR